MSKVHQAVLDLAQGVDRFDRTIQCLVDEWTPDPPPINTSMSAIGRSFVEVINPTKEDAARVFASVEVILQQGSDSEKDAVATGFLEAVVAAIDRNPNSRWVLEYAGPAAKAYLLEWNRFCGSD